MVKKIDLRSVLLVGTAFASTAINPVVPGALLDEVAGLEVLVVILGVDGLRVVLVASFSY